MRTAAMIVAVLITASGCARSNQRVPTSPVASPPPAATDPAPTPAPPPPPVATMPDAQTVPPASALREVFPHVWVDAAAGIVELDGSVPINAHDEAMPRVYLEVCVCTPDTKEHESLVVTPATPSHVHAALLLLGLEPGKPGDWDWEGTTVTPVPPTGPAVRVEVEYTRDGATVRAPLSDWAVNVTDGATLTTLHAGDGFVFAGSQMLKRRAESIYRADGEGCLVGLTAFGGETIAWSRMFHHDSSLAEPMWIAHRERVPAFGTPVRVRISRP